MVAFLREHGNATFLPRFKIEKSQTRNQEDTLIDHEQVVQT